MTTDTRKKMEYIFYRYNPDVEEEVEIERKHFALESSAWRHAGKLEEKYAGVIDVRVVMDEDE